MMVIRVSAYLMLKKMFGANNVDIVENGFLFPHCLFFSTHNDEIFINFMLFRGFVFVCFNISSWRISRVVFVLSVGWCVDWLIFYRKRNDKRFVWRTLILTTLIKFKSKTRLQVHYQMSDSNSLYSYKSFVRMFERHELKCS